MTGESPDRSQREKSSGETTEERAPVPQESGTADGAGAACARPSEQAPETGTEDGAVSGANAGQQESGSAAESAAAAESGQSEADEPPAAEGDARLKAAVAAWVAGAPETGESADSAGAKPGANPAGQQPGPAEESGSAGEPGDPEPAEADTSGAPDTAAAAAASADLPVRKKAAGKQRSKSTSRSGGPPSRDAADATTSEPDQPTAMFHTVGQRTDTGGESAAAQRAERMTAAFFGAAKGDRTSESENGEAGNVTADQDQESGQGDQPTAVFRVPENGTEQSGGPGTEQSGDSTAGRENGAGRQTNGGKNQSRPRSRDTGQSPGRNQTQGRNQSRNQGKKNRGGKKGGATRNADSGAQPPADQPTAVFRAPGSSGANGTSGATDSAGEATPGGTPDPRRGWRAGSGASSAAATDDSADSGQATRSGAKSPAAGASSPAAGEPSEEPGKDADAESGAQPPSAQKPAAADDEANTEGAKAEEATSEGADAEDAHSETPNAGSSSNTESANSGDAGTGDGDVPARADEESAGDLPQGEGSANAPSGGGDSATDSSQDAETGEDSEAASDAAEPDAAQTTTETPDKPGGSSEAGESGDSSEADATDPAGESAESGESGDSGSAGEHAAVSAQDTDSEEGAAETEQQGPASEPDVDTEQDDAASGSGTGEGGHEGTGEAGGEGADEESEAEQTSQFVRLRSADEARPPAKQPKPVVPPKPSGRPHTPPRQPGTSAAGTGPAGSKAAGTGRTDAAGTAAGPLAGAHKSAPLPAEEPTAAPQLSEADLTRQQPRPDQEPMDLLAQLTNRPPPPETPIRTVLRRVKIWTPLVLLLAIVFVIVQVVRPLPGPELKLTSASSYTFKGQQSSVPWPSEGQAVLQVDGLGSLGSYGKQKPVPIASVAKVMTAYLMLRDHPVKKGSSGDKITVDKKAEDEAGLSAQNESTVDVKKGDKLSQKQALQALMIASANNVARLVARWDSGSEGAFVSKMNATAKKLGMKNTKYTDPSGLQHSTVSTAADQTKLAKKVMTDPLFRQVVRQPGYTDAKGKKQSNWNKLVPLDGVVGIKTGTTTKAGGNLVFAAEKKIGGTKQLVVGAMLGQYKPSILDTVLGESKKLITHAQDSLKSRKVVRKGDVVGYADDQLGGKTPVVATRDLSAVGWSGLKVRINLSGGSKGVPHTGKAGDKVGEVTVGDGPGEAKAPVALQKDMEEPGLGAQLTRIL